VTINATIIALAAALLATGCTTFDLDTRFTKPNGTIAETSRDEWECHREVVDQPETLNVWVGGPVDAVRVFEEAEERELLMNNCMRLRGYEPTEREGWLKSVSLKSMGF
jgi:hypothetical protein